MSERKPFLLRIDPAIWAELESWAQAELRSVNGQIEYLLRQAIQQRRRSAAQTAVLEEGHSPGPPEGGSKKKPKSGR